MGSEMCIRDSDNGIDLFFHLRKHQYSSTELRNRVHHLEELKRSENNIVSPEQYSPKILEKYGLTDGDK